MSKEKKQFLVLGVLVLLVCAVGAFQFMGPGSKKPVVVEDEATIEKPAIEVVATNDELDPTQELIKQLMAGPGYTSRDPFAPQAVMADAPTQHEEPYQQPVERVRSEFEQDPNVTPVNPIGLVEGTTVVATDAPFGLQGVVIGRRTVAVFLEDDGQFRIAEVGDKIGQSTYVEEVNEKQVILRHRGKLRVLKLQGGN